MRGLKFAALIGGLTGLLCLLALGGCEPRDATRAATAAAPVRTTVTALVWAPDWPEEMLKIAAEFDQANPDVHVNVQFMIGNSVEENIKPRVAAGTLPDLISVNPNAYAAELADQGILADVRGTTAWSQMLEPLKGDWTSRRGKGFGISGGVATTMIYYNRAMFARAGIKTLPTNFDEFLDVCARLKRAGMIPIMWNGGFPNMLGNGPFASGFANNVVAREPDWKQKMADGTLNLNTPEVADIFARIALIPERGYVQPAFMTTGYDEGMRLFKDGQAAMAFQGSWAAGMMMRGNRFEAGVFVPPWNAPGQTVVPVLGSETGFAVCETPRKAAAMRFLEFIAGRGFPILQRKRHNISPFENGAGTAVSDREIVAYTQTLSRYPVTASPYYSSLPSNTIELVHNLMHDVLLKKITPREAAKRLDESVKTEAKMHYK
ncbi:ABC transporter substrate-binding protein [Paraburkholderia acidisoli]|uniref:Extracellular solute-binding protein n=1 Tax=Paraburkholderia acidisoli TaxID=2571748 RepID=A0A7Z2GNU2_9BURK|nr:extracellular solute-binding protein [Paraburkholderia acidisoli]QGZ65193.1 extracellular solute-binding protein [Paraburkholderia acidisoli]